MLACLQVVVRSASCQRANSFSTLKEVTGSALYLAAGFAALRAFPLKAALSSAHFRPASLDLGLAFRWPISRARRQMRGDRIKCLGLRTYRTSCINATDSICRRARTESQSVVKLGQWARVDDKSNRSRSACGNATCGTFQHFRIAHPSTFSETDYCLKPVKNAIIWVVDCYAKIGRDDL